ncbi:MAG: nuclear transport factor 2 family protein [Holophagaceae bacterium]|uniref:Nuclear transport factor 2 family protein n=1 Tax=Candidatus Geothrix skivensis TaxID=2954439 RepID=A0A9D7XJL1_9BACT|nr:nuclear transport factor 2 family protein [Candidatus Geothrix skivensis]
MIRSLSCLLVPALLMAAPTPKNLSPAGTVERQIELFNAHDLEGFLALFAEELEVFELPGAAAPTGKARLRELYAARFKANPDLHASAQAQMVSGEFVIQKEKIKGRAGKEPLVAVTIYQVKGGKILRMWGLRE